MNWPNSVRVAPPSHSYDGEPSLEDYARAVRVYQEILLELQNSKPEHAEIVGDLLNRAAAAKETVNYYRSAHGRIS